jgi:lincosamide nucleotidyltransferase A/C/D/E
VDGAQALATYEALRGADVACWVMGGWGVDALLARQSRPHKDLDLLVAFGSMAAYTATTSALGFSRKLEWEENRRVDTSGGAVDTAFVDGHPDGREIDVHVVDVGVDGTLHQLYADAWPLPADALTGVGLIEGTEVHCVSVAAQLAMHSTYVLPAKHLEDLRLLEQLA